MRPRLSSKTGSRLKIQFPLCTALLVVAAARYAQALKQTALAISEDFGARTHPSTVPRALINTNVIANSSTTNANEIGPQKQASQFSWRPFGEVSQLRPSAGLRSVNLSWQFEGPEEPAAFVIRFCELTSWNIEIKCRQRELQTEPKSTVIDTRAKLGDNKHENNNHINSNYSNSRNHDVNPNSLQLSSYRRLGERLRAYETQLFDLRALTSYTFRVRASRFHNSADVANVASKLGGHNDMTTSAQSPDSRPEVRVWRSRSPAASARRMDAINEVPRGFDRPEVIDTNGLVSLDDSPAVRVETKPFGASLSKCLANSSEVLVSTGRHFGGRISVEGSNEARCQLLGNRSSEQEVYLFEIDHRLCSSKLRDAERVETSILVHENKDILTHNTARFLVMCNFQQKPFTVQASVALPKVLGGQLPAPGRPSVSPRSDSGAPVMLGSIPGVFRWRGRLKDASTSINSIEESAADLPTSSRMPPVKVSPSGRAPEARGRSLALALPPPVKVQSRALFVERPGSESRSGRQYLASISVSDPQPSDLAATPPSFEPLPAGSASDELEDRSLPLVLTNNHRVSGELVQMPAAGPAQSSSLANFTIRYATKPSIAEIPALLATSEEGTQPTVRKRQRAGRMHTMEPLETAASGSSFVAVADGPMIRHEEGRGFREQQPDPARMSTPGNLERLGDSLPPSSSLPASKRPIDEQDDQQAGSPSLAQNITGYLLRWSLRQLNNLAKHSLESLANRGEAMAEAERSVAAETARAALLEPRRATHSQGVAFPLKPITTGSVASSSPATFKNSSEERPVSVAAISDSKAQQMTHLSTKPPEVQQVSRSEDPVQIATPRSAEKVEHSYTVRQAPDQPTRRMSTARAPQATGSHSSSRLTSGDSFAPGLLLCVGGSLLVALVLGSLASLWLVMRPKRRPTVRRQFVTRTTVLPPGLGGPFDCDRSKYQPPSFSSSPSVSIQTPSSSSQTGSRDFTNGENYATDSIDRRLLITGHSQRNMIGAEESDCKNSEIHCTEHVLVGARPYPDESYA